MTSKTIFKVSKVQKCMSQYTLWTNEK